jgi:hypothetical protein
VCKEDIRLARAAVLNEVESAGAPTTHRVFGASSNRYAFTGRMDFADPTIVPAATGMFAVKVGVGWAPLLSLNVHEQGGHVSLQEVGALIFGEIWWVNDSISNCTAVYAASTGFDKALEDI